MNDALREAAAVDPAWAKREARRQFILKATVAGTMLALAIGTLAFVLSFHDAERITHVEHSACQSDPAGLECQRARRESARAETVATACIAFHQVGYRCPKRNKARKTASEYGASPAPSGEVMPSSPSTGESQPGRHEGGSGGSTKVGAGRGGNESPERLPSAGASQPPAASAPGPTPEAPVRQGAGVLLESVGGVAEETDGTVNEVVGGVTGTTCELAKLLCKQP